MEPHNPTAFLENILEQVIQHLEEENTRRAANCARLRTENERLQANRLSVVRTLTCLPLGGYRTLSTLQRQAEVQQACVGVVRACIEQTEEAKLHTEEQYKECSAAEELQRQAGQQYDDFTMMPYHDVEAKIERLRSESLHMQAKTASIVETRQASLTQIETRIKEMEAEKKLFDQLIVEINNGEVHLDLALQQSRQQHEQSIKRVQELEIEIAELQQKLTQSRASI